MIDFDEINWDVIASRLPSVPDPRLRSGKLAERDYWIINAGTNSKNRQVAGDVASLLTAQARRWEGSWFRNIAFKAAQRGVSFEDMFVQFALGLDPDAIGEDMSEQVNREDFNLEDEQD